MVRHSARGEAPDGRGAAATSTGAPATDAAGQRFDATRQSVQLDPEELAALRLRLRRAQGQIGAILGMVDEGRQCREIVHVLSAAQGALDRAGFILLNRAMRQCATDPESTQDDLAALERLFLELS